MNDSLMETIRRLPKVEIHCHLEGAIPLETLWALVEKYGAASEVGGISELRAKFQYTDFPHFLETWSWKNGFLREYDDFTFIAASVAKDLRRQNLRYVETFHSPGDFAVAHGLEVARITEAVRKGLRQHADQIEVNLIADLTRDFGPELGMRWLHELAEVRELGVIGIGIGGSEHDHPPEPYQAVYKQARQYGFRTTAHAGEAAGPDSIWGAIRALRVDRIGHGTRAVEDPELVAYLKEKQIPLEMCPISNLRTGVVSTLEAHPIGEFYRAGLLVSVNTDDPKMFNTSLETEYEALVEAKGFELRDIKKLIQNGIASTWCDEPRKSKLLAELTD